MRGDVDLFGGSPGDFGPPSPWFSWPRLFAVMLLLATGVAALRIIRGWL